MPTYIPEAFARDGFVHCTDGAENLVAVGNRYYVDDPRVFVALVIDLGVVTANVRYEDPAAIYPHIYGPVPAAAVVAVLAVRRDPAGRFLAIEDPG